MNQNVLRLQRLLELWNVHVPHGALFVNRLRGNRARGLPGEDGRGNHAQHIPRVAVGAGGAADGEQIVRVLGDQTAQRHLVQAVAVVKIVDQAHGVLRRAEHVRRGQRTNAANVARGAQLRHGGNGGDVARARIVVLQTLQHFQLIAHEVVRHVLAGGAAEPAHVGRMVMAVQRGAAAAEIRVQAADVPRLHGAGAALQRRAEGHIGEIVFALHGGNARAGAEVGVAGSVDEHPRAVGFLAGFIGNDHARQRCALALAARNHAVQKQRNPGALDFLQQRQREEIRRIADAIAIARRRGRLARLPTLAGVRPAVFARQVHKFLAHAADDQSPAAVVHRHKQVDQADRAQPAQHQRFFD